MLRRRSPRGRANILKFIGEETEVNRGEAGRTGAGRLPQY
jgi:hypothetical protein